MPYNVTWIHLGRGTARFVVGTWSKHSGTPHSHSPAPSSSFLAITTCTIYIIVTPNSQASVKNDVIALRVQQTGLTSSSKSRLCLWRSFCSAMWDIGRRLIKYTMLATTSSGNRATCCRICAMSTPPCWPWPGLILSCLYMPICKRVKSKMGTI